MPSFRVLAPVAVVAAGLIGVAAVAPASTSSGADAEPVVTEPAPIAEAAGTDAVTITIPSAVNVRLVRSEAALERATADIDTGQSAQAVVDMNAALVNANRAWAAAKTIIQTTPPPVDPEAEEGSVGHASGDPVAAGPTFATVDQTAGAVFNLQHELITTGLGLLDSADASTAAKLQQMVRSQVNQRDAAIDFIHGIAPPVDPEAEEGSFAEASGDPVAGLVDWPTQMAAVTALVGDELQQTALTKASPSVTPAFVRRIKNRDIVTQATLNTYWPPVPAED